MTRYLKALRQTDDEMMADLLSSTQVATGQISHKMKYEDIERCSKAAIRSGDSMLRKLSSVRDVSDIILECALDDPNRRVQFNKGDKQE